MLGDGAVSKPHVFTYLLTTKTKRDENGMNT